MLNIKKWYKNIIDGDVDVSKRRVIKTAAGLAALTVVGGGVASLLKEKSIQEKIASGLIENESFYIYEPVVIDIPNVTIRNCSFEAMAPMDHMIYVSSGGVHLENCYLDSSNMVDTCIRLDAPLSGADMTTSLQSAFDSSRTVYLSPGTYHINQPLVNNFTKPIKESDLLFKPFSGTTYA